MTKQEAIEKLNAIDDFDVEMAHAEADKILLAVLQNNSFPEVVAAWEALSQRCDGFWYA